MMSEHCDPLATTPTKQAAWLLAQRQVADNRLQTAWLTNDMGVLRLFSWVDSVATLQSFQPYKLEFVDRNITWVARAGSSLWPPSGNILFAQYCNDCLRLCLAEGEPSNLAASYGELLLALQSRSWQSLWQNFERQLVTQALSMAVVENEPWRAQFLAALPETMRPLIEQQRSLLESMQ